ncbi:MAG: serine/threonine protein kinase with repeat, partial [Chthoniobacteraceae bacterium]|nr:serine/threonine protein kinase with repeat [Chthoniobacteraceae bacterium]
DRMPPGNENILMWDLLAGTALAPFSVSSRSTLDAVFSPDGCMFATATTDNTIALWDTRSGTLIGTCAGHKQLVRAIAFARDGQTLASASDDSTVRLWNIATQQELLSILHLGDNVSSLLFSPNDRTLVAGRSHSRSLRFHRAPLLAETEETDGEPSGGK